MNSIKRLITEEDRWNNAEGDNFLLRFRPHLKDFISLNKYKHRLIISWEYDSDNNAYLPSAQELELMEEVESSLVALLEDDLQAILAFVYTGNNKREWHWYSRDIAKTQKLVKEIFSNFNLLPIKFLIEKDPGWTEYLAVLEGAESS